MGWMFDDPDLAVGERTAEPMAKARPASRTRESGVVQRVVHRSGAATDGVMQRALADSRIRPAADPSGRAGRLPEDLAIGVEAMSGLAMDDVRVHLNSSRPAQVGAAAYTMGSEIHVAPGQERHLPHEAWHVVQQAQGRVRSRVQLAGGQALNDDAGLEREAEVMGSRAATRRIRRRGDVSVSPLPGHDSGSRTRTIQRYVTVNNAAGAVQVNALPGAGGAVVPPPTEFEAQRPPQPGDAGPAVLVAGAPAALRVSEDGLMAIEDSDLTGRQPKVFYADPAVWHASNAALANSTFELYAARAAALTITLPGQGPQLLDRVMARTRVALGVVHAANETGLGLDVPQDCIMMATAIIGAPPPGQQQRETVALGGAATSRGSGEYQTAKAMLAWAKSRSSKPWPNSWWELATKGTNHRAARLALKDFQKNLGAGAGMQALARQYALLKQNHPALAAQAASALGVNIHVQPAVGEAYESYQLGLPNNFMAGPGPDWEADTTGATMASLTSQGAVGAPPTRHGWGQHIGAVVAESSGNRITLENYARSHELGNMRQGPDSYFQMYGPPHLPQQTWHHAWTAGAVAAGLPPVKNAITILVRP